MNSDARLYANKLLNLYMGLPDTPNRTSRYDRQLAFNLHQQNVPLETVEAAFLLASARRLLRDPSYPPLAPIRSLHYFLPIIQEVIAAPLPKGYLNYIRQKLARHAAQHPAPSQTDLSG